MAKNYKRKKFLKLSPKMKNKLNVRMNIIKIIFKI